MALALGVLSCTGVAAAADRLQTIAAVAELKRLTLEELLSLEVTSVSRRPERASEAAAAVHVITEEEIRRSGARSLPEALRLAPNLQVAQSNARNWAITARGFNATFSNKLLVLIDGRTVYTPLYSGVFWDAQDTLLEDLERVEVISGPGATVWGANAVNGVINVISKPAQQTQGALISGGGGTEERAFGAVRFGGRAGEDVYFRVYAKGFERDGSARPDGRGDVDAWGMAQTGFRTDWEPDAHNQLTVQGDYYRGQGGQRRAADITHSGGNLLGRWTHRWSESEELQVQAYFDRTRRLDPGEFGDDLDTFDLDAQYERDFGERHHVMVGAGYRFTRNRVTNFPASAFLPAVLNRSLVSAFVQDEISFRDDAVKVMLGSKFEHNDYTGVEVQPTLRGSWTWNHHVWWASISRAVRTPARFDRHLFVPATPPFVLTGSSAFESEEVVAYELGWRVQPFERVFVDAALFVNDYDKIRGISGGPPFVIGNEVEGEFHGVELAVTWQVTEPWRLIAGYTLLEEELRVRPGRSDISGGQGEAFDPRHQFQLRSALELGVLELNLWFRYVDEVGNTSARGFGVVPAYTTLDVRIGWTVTDMLELSIVGQNLLDSQHPEFGTNEIERSVYGKATWRF